MVVALPVALSLSVSAYPVYAGNTSNVTKAKKAYKKAIESGKISLSSKSNSALVDVTGDKIPEILSRNYSKSRDYSKDAVFTVYTYDQKKNKVKRLINENYGLESIVFNASSKVLTTDGGGDGLWIYNYKLKKNGKLKLVNEYHLDYDKELSDYEYEYVYYKQIGNKKTKITEDAFYAVLKKAAKKDSLTLSKSQLLKKLQTKSTKTVYSTSGVSIRKFSKSGKKLKVITVDSIYKGKKALKKKVRTFKIAKNCKWIREIGGMRHPENKGTTKISYKKMKKMVKNCYGLPENGYYTVRFTEKNGKLVEVRWISL